MKARNLIFRAALLIAYSFQSCKYEVIDRLIFGTLCVSIQLKHYSCLILRQQKQLHGWLPT